MIDIDIDVDIRKVAYVNINKRNLVKFDVMIKHLWDIGAISDFELLTTYDDLIDLESSNPNCSKLLLSVLDELEYKKFTGGDVIISWERNK